MKSLYVIFLALTVVIAIAVEATVTANGNGLTQEALAYGSQGQGLSFGGPLDFGDLSGLELQSYAALGQNPNAPLGPLAGQQGIPLGGYGLPQLGGQLHGGIQNSISLLPSGPAPIPAANQSRGSGQILGVGIPQSASYGPPPPIPQPVAPLPTPSQQGQSAPPPSLPALLPSAQPASAQISSAASSSQPAPAAPRQFILPSAPQYQLPPLPYQPTLLPSGPAQGYPSTLLQLAYYPPPPQPLIIQTSGPASLPSGPGSFPSGPAPSPASAPQAPPPPQPQQQPQPEPIQPPAPIPGPTSIAAFPFPTPAPGTQPPRAPPNPAPVVGRLGSGSLGYTSFGNGLIALGSGSLGYTPPETANPPPQLQRLQTNTAYAGIQANLPGLYGPGSDSNYGGLSLSPSSGASFDLTSNLLGYGNGLGLIGSIKAFQNLASHL